MVWHAVPWWVQNLFPERVWKNNETENSVHLTFDDGPVPGATDYVLKELEVRKMKATFFMVGDNVRKYPNLAKEVLANGHAIGNHTFHHLNGWKTAKDIYMEDITECDRIIQGILGITPRLFRPPYGLMSPNQARLVLKQKKVIMWDVLSGDYDSSLSSDLILKETMKLTKPGSVILFHDQEKTKKMLRDILPPFLDHVLEMNWRTKSL
ncbi:polysaccharide deacetylase family protein [Algoriphagus namhaensis]|uniref:Polysaccharide deacetylase family protein n=1 Tax=Algoriphagus namhaensis TaxID=915353 RepID=A0ABV8ARN2_9BACT